MSDEPIYYASTEFSGLGFFDPDAGGLPSDATRIDPKYVDPDVRMDGREWLASLRAARRFAEECALTPQRIVVTEEQFDAIMALLDEPPKPSPKLVELFARPSVFDAG